MRLFPIALLALSAAAACTRPDLPPPSDGAAARAPWPALLPLESLTAPAPAPIDPAAEVLARAAALRARAAALQQAGG